MMTKSRVFSTRAAVAASVFGIAILGLRSQAAEVPSTSIPVRPPAVAADESHRYDVRRVADASLLVLGSDADGVTRAGPATIVDGDDGRLVPAIYAWDPDVRFVYYRHVSKWM